MNINQHNWIRAGNHHSASAVRPLPVTKHTTNTIVDNNQYRSWALPSALLPSRSDNFARNAFGNNARRGLINAKNGRKA